MISSVPVAKRPNSLGDRQDVEKRVVVAGTRRDDLPRVQIELALTSQHMIGRGFCRG
jgi:hypothetical protein